MASLHKSLFIEGVNYSLLFCKIIVPNGIKYFVSVSRGEEMSVYFEIEKNGPGWRILTPAPSWVFDILPKILDG
jgi:hypothetical protein